MAEVQMIGPKLLGDKPENFRIDSRVPREILDEIGEDPTSKSVALVEDASELESLSLPQVRKNLKRRGFQEFEDRKAVQFATGASLKGTDLPGGILVSGYWQRCEWKKSSESISDFRTKARKSFLQSRFQFNSKGAIFFSSIRAEYNAAPLAVDRSVNATVLNLIVNANPALKGKLVERFETIQVSNLEEILAGRGFQLRPQIVFEFAEIAKAGWVSVDVEDANRIWAIENDGRWMQCVVESISGSAWPAAQIATRVPGVLHAFDGWFAKNNPRADRSDPNTWGEFTNSLYLLSMDQEEKPSGLLESAPVEMPSGRAGRRRF